jgi:hypothetical protein
MMMQFSPTPKSPQSPDPAFEAWRNYAARVSQALQERREDAYEAPRNDAGAKPNSGNYPFDIGDTTGSVPATGRRKAGAP